jgi:hypothetical protein
MVNRPSYLSTVFGFLFGPYAPLARHIFHSTLMFLFILVCFFFARKGLTVLFPPLPSEDTDYVSAALRIIDTYARSLGLIGFIVWTSREVAFLLWARVKHGDKVE